LNLAQEVDMGYAQRQYVMTADEFLAWEATQLERHEFVNGEVFAMSGAEMRHVTVSLDVAMALRQHLSGSGCRTYISDAKLAAADNSSFFYPDVFVTCSEADHRDPLVQREPTLIVEVLSPSTASYDLSGKFAYYRQIASLREVAFIDLDMRRTDVYRKGADGLWVLHSFDRGADVRLASVDLTITAAILFAEVGEATPTPQ
jgi:Uma2 family endonuclease